MGFHGLKEKPYVVGTCNDLVLCCQTRHDQDQLDFYICNPCTRQWIALPPTTRRCTNVPVGFICDRYYEENSTSGTNSTVNIKKDYRCKVVRILPHDLSEDNYFTHFSKFIVEVFSFETGEWRESIVSSPRSIRFEPATSVAYNGMLYWTYWQYESVGQIGLIGLDPFVIGNSSASPNGDETVDDDHYQFRLFDAVYCGFGFDMPWICMRRGRLQMWGYNYRDADLTVWELTCDDDLGSADEFYLKNVSVFPVTTCEVSESNVVVLALDPNDEDIFYVEVYDGSFLNYFMYNICTRKWSKVAITKHVEDDHLFRLVLPWWPTPLRKLPVVEELPI
ncbi:putative six-bladed beta-propeller, TolB [Rosa chinensis]|uniref:Putative six-bladed beta-propeller, TolB n=1 Tax=Rosa chinensis TaxID=74649 RepID=A0A2P6QMY7_ROSCH|nr:putative six-bladed beta-propeller, TolB [Rosa chinensis]